MDTNECSLCRPGGFALTRQMFQFAGIEIPEAGAAETESTDPAVPLSVIDIGCGSGSRSSMEIWNSSARHWGRTGRF